MDVPQPAAGVIKEVLVSWATRFQRRRVLIKLEPPARRCGGTCLRRPPPPLRRPLRRPGGRAAHGHAGNADVEYDMLVSRRRPGGYPPPSAPPTSA